MKFTPAEESKIESVMGAISAIGMGGQNQHYRNAAIAALKVLGILQQDDDQDEQLPSTQEIELAKFVLLNNFVAATLGSDALLQAQRIISRALGIPK